MVGAVDLLFVNLFRFEWLVTTWPFSLLMSGLWIGIYGLMSLGNIIAFLRLDHKYHIVKNRPGMIIAFLLRGALFVGSLLLAMVTTKLIKTPLEGGGFSLSIAHPMWPLIVANAIVFLLVESPYYIHVIGPAQNRYLELRRKRERAEKKEKARGPS